MKTKYKLLGFGVLLVGFMACEVQEEIIPNASLLEVNDSAIDEFIPANGCADCKLETAVEEDSQFPWGVLLYDTENHTD